MSTNRPELLESEGETEASHVGIEARLEEASLLAKKKKLQHSPFTFVKTLVVKFIVYKVTHELSVKQSCKLYLSPTVSSTPSSVLPPSH